MVPRMRRLLMPILLGLSACAPSSYVYSFDLSDPGAKNLTKPGERDVLEDPDLRTEILVDPTSFQAIALDITNKTDAPVAVNWAGIYVITPDHTQQWLKPDAPQTEVASHVKATARLIPFSLPAAGPGAAVYDNSTFELVIPMTVRGQGRDYRLHLLARVKKL